MLDVLLLLAAGLVIAWIVVVLMTWRLLVRPRRRGYAWALARNRPGDPRELDPPLEFDAWTFRSRGRDLAAWRIRGRRERGPVVVVTHGWGESRTTLLPRIAALAGVARSVVAWDLPGHGDSPGACELGVGEVDDLGALVRLIDGPVVLYGWSLGAGISIACARDSGVASRVAAVIAEAPYRMPHTPARAMMRAFGLPSALNLSPALVLARARTGRLRWTGFDRAAHAASVACPLLVIHGEQDAISPIEDGRAIAAAAPLGTFRSLAIADHDTDWADDPAVLAWVVSWMSASLHESGS